MDFKNDKGAEPALPEVATARGRPRPTRFRKSLIRIGIALSLSLLYHLSHSFQVTHKIKAWKHFSSDGSKSFDDYINRVEEAFLSVPSHVSKFDSSN